MPSKKLGVEELLRPDNHFGEYWIPGQNNFFPDLETEAKVLVLGMLDACPVPHTMIEQFSADWIIARYTECNLVGGFILEKAKELNPLLYKQLTCIRYRRSDEKPTGFEEVAVPADYEVLLYPGSSAAGYAASRILIEQFGRKKPWQIGEDRVKVGLQVLEESLLAARSPIDFLVLLAAGVTERSADMTAVLSHLLAVELLEEAIYTQIKQICVAMRDRAPRLWGYYLSLNREERNKAGILVFADLF
jgi:hypothetical protein